MRNFGLGSLSNSNRSMFMSCVCLQSTWLMDLIANARRVLRITVCCLLQYLINSRGDYSLENNLNRSLGTCWIYCLWWWIIATYDSKDIMQQIFHEYKDPSNLWRCHIMQKRISGKTLIRRHQADLSVRRKEWEMFMQLFIIGQGRQTSQVQRSCEPETNSDWKEHQLRWSKQIITTLYFSGFWVWISLLDVYFITYSLIARHAYR